ncbi:MAG: hypothetical protein ACRD3B_02060 [Candidatus Sulfotelmatobacter sp.]
MPPKKTKKTQRKNQRTKSRNTTAKKTRRVAAGKAAASKKKRTAPARKTAARPAVRKKRPSVNPEREIKEELRKKVASTRTASGRQGGDLQGLSRAEEADSESVEELVEEGNLFEAGAVAGVEEADNSDEQEVHTHEFPEDDVPKEYLDEE